MVGDAHRDALGLGPLGNRQLFGRVEDREIDVAGIVELEGPVLAHGDAEQARRGPGLGVANLGQGSPINLQPHRLGQGGVQRRVGEPSQGPGHCVQIPNATQIAQGGQQVQVGLEFPQHPAGCFEVRLGGDSLSGGQDLRQTNVRIGVQDRR